MTWSQILERIWKLRYFIVFSAGICAAAATVIVWLTPERYLATATIQLETKFQANAEQYAVTNKQIDNFVKSQAAVIKDPRVTGMVAERLGWTNSYALAQQFNNSSAAGNRDFRTWLGDIIADGIILNFTEGSPSFTVGYVGLSPVEAQTMVGFIRDAYIENSRYEGRRNAGENEAKLDREIAQLRERMTAIEDRNTAFGKANDVILNADGISLTEMRMNSAVSALVLPSRPKVEIPVGSAAYDRQLSEIDGEIARFSQSLGPNHPRLKDLRAQREELAVAANKIVTPQPVERGPSPEEIRKQRENEYLAKAGAIETAKRYHAELELLEARFAALTQQRENYALDSVSQRPGASSGGAVSARGDVYYPRANFAIPAAAGFGALFAMLTGLLFSLLQIRVRSAEDLKSLDLKVLGTGEKRSGRKNSKLLRPVFRAA
ncbi:hypothetical protein E3U23_07815 [Erythrobacter litoralis]|uniref:hypothetical protein n=1 Tax=Erythrobacter litoralis TaxID=39960 RepID=UPI0024352243|nr:hypothetical protein [Erythrobacter litoralis]MDG6079096.1 hypothetical protein [Erythrobacter litoralis]